MDCVVTCLHDGIRRQYFLLDLRLRLGAAHSGEVTHGVFGRHRLASAGLARNDDRLVLVKPAGQTCLFESSAAVADY